MPGGLFEHQGLFEVYFSRPQAKNHPRRSKPPINHFLLVNRVAKKQTETRMPETGISRAR